MKRILRMSINKPNFSFAQLRCRKMAWMKELQWGWFIVFIDAFSVTQPLRLCVDPCHKLNSLGFSTENKSQAPPSKTQSS